MLLATMALMAAATPPVAADMSICQSVDPYLADGTRREPSQEAQFKRLDELPPANMILTVLRTEDGCITPVMVRYGVGATSKTEE